MMESLIATIIVIYVLSMVVFLVHTIKKRNEALRQVRTRLCFSEVKTVDRALLERITPIVQNRSEKITISNVFKRDEGSLTLYDCHIYSSRRKNNKSRSSVLVVSGVDFPAFRMAPVMFKSGMFSGLIRKALQFAMTQGGFSQIDTSYMPDFAAKYILAAKEPDRVRTEIPSHIWRELMELSGHLFIRGQGDTFILAVMDFSAMRKRGNVAVREAEHLERAVKIASALGRIFRSIQREAAYSLGR